MKERMIFEKSGLVNDENDTKELELWGHDGGEYFWVEGVEPVKKEEKTEEHKGDLSSLDMLRQIDV